ncbi:hypothetical protein U91I_04088 [alpha proteobacterium U9-1i]|nr:hypothetical protein U91I_04088 [alpha proteobacterium U9-1i]
MALALAACGQSSEAPKQEEAPAISEAPVVEADLSIGFNGAAGINAALPMSVAALTAAAPGFAVAETPDQIEGHAFTAITLSANGAEQFRVLPTHDAAYVHSIVTRSPAVRSGAGETIGVSTYAQAPRAEVAFCGAEPYQGAVAFGCSTSESGRFWRVYSLPAGYDGPSQPFDAIDPDFTERAVLTEMRWIAPRVQGMED